MLDGIHFHSVSNFLSESDSATFPQFYPSHLLDFDQCDKSQHNLKEGNFLLGGSGVQPKVIWNFEEG